ENPCGRRWQGPTTELHRHWWTGPRQPSRRRSLEYASIAARRHRRQGLRQSNSASADQGRRGPADHPEPPQRDQTGLLSEAFLSAAAQDRKLLLSYQGLAAHRHPLRQTCSKFSCRRDPHRRTLLDQVVSPDPNIPIVVVVSNDPVESGLVASLARPGGNITGLTYVHDMLAGKSVELLKDTVPSVSRVAILWNPNHA